MQLFTQLMVLSLFNPHTQGVNAFVHCYSSASSILTTNFPFSTAIIHTENRYGAVGTNLLQTKTDSLGTLNGIYLLALAYNLFYDVTKIIEELKKKFSI